MSKNKNNNDNGNEKNFVYCGLFKCPNTNCLRHHIHEPWGVIIYERKFSPDKEWNCKDIVEEVYEKNLLGGCYGGL